MAAYFDILIDFQPYFFAFFSFLFVFSSLLLFQKRRKKNQKDKKILIESQVDLQLKKASFFEDLKKDFQKSKSSSDLRETFFEFLIDGNFGYDVSQQILDALPVENLSWEDGLEAIQKILRHLLKKYEFKLSSFDLQDPKGVILLLGVNGAGKTTTAAKLAHLSVQNEQKKTLLVPADTFRAGAVDQLKAWSERIPCDFLDVSEKTPPSALAYQGAQRVQKGDCDCCIIDTAGRFQNKVNLMEELKKIKRVIQKVNPAFPMATFLVLDATTGQNLLQQVDLFHEAMDVDGLILNKMDGLSRGGLIFHLLADKKIPLVYEGRGEGLSDLKAFSSEGFLKSFF